MKMRMMSDDATGEEKGEDTGEERDKTAKDSDATEDGL